MPDEESIRSVESDDYADTIDSGALVVVAMGTATCAPWATFLPTFMEVATALGNGDMTFVTCDLGRNPAIAMLEGVTRVPCVVIYRDGRRVGVHVGAMGASELLLAISDALGPVIDGM